MVCLLSSLLPLGPNYGPMRLRFGGEFFLVYKKVKQKVLIIKLGSLIEF